MLIIKALILCILVLLAFIGAAAISLMVMTIKDDKKKINKSK